jgi:L-glutamine-phosphate cytidylyltransferase
MMQAVIPAAGLGSRMGVASAQSHKGLLDIAGRSILEHSVAHLKAAGIEDILVVTGFNAKLVEQRLGDTVKCRYNPFYQVAGILGSFWQAMPVVDGKPFMFTFADHFFHPSLIDRCINQSADAMVMVQKKKQYTQEDSKVILREDGTVYFGKDIELAETTGEYTGLTVFSAHGSSVFFAELRKILEAGDLRAYAMDVLNSVFQRADVTTAFEYCDESSRIEVDTVADLTDARAMATGILADVDASIRVARRTTG